MQVNSKYSWKRARVRSGAETAADRLRISACFQKESGTDALVLRVDLIESIE